MTNLAEKKCAACAAGGEPLKGPALKQFYQQLSKGWTVIDEHHLEKEYKFKNFRQALDFTNEIGNIAEQEGHHPDILLSWGKVKMTFWTHKINGLSESDFIMAAKCDAAFAYKFEKIL